MSPTSAAGLSPTGVPAGSSDVIGIDLSLRMIEVAREQSVDLDTFFLEPSDVVSDIEAAGFFTMSTLVRRPSAGVE